MKKKVIRSKPSNLKGYSSVVSDISQVIELARSSVSRSVNSIMTAAYWLIGWRIVEFEQGGKTRAEYGEAILKNLSDDLTKRFGRGYSRQNLQQMRQFYLRFSDKKISQTVSGKLKQTPAKEKRPTKSSISHKALADFFPGKFSKKFPLPWSAYVRLLAVKNENALKFYEKEALRGGWSVRQLDRQINSQFYERTALSKNKASMLEKGQRKSPGDSLTPDEEIKDPYVLEFLNLKDEYSESDLEEALIGHLETFLLELGGDFSFVARQKRLRIDDEWYRVDLVFYHRRLRCLVLIDLKLGKFTHADAGQMHLYLNYAAENWTHKEENPPVGVILCARKTDNVVRYALDNLPNKVLAAEYKTALPDEKTIAKELSRTRKMLEQRRSLKK